MSAVGYRTNPATERGGEWGMIVGLQAGRIGV